MDKPVTLEPVAVVDKKAEKERKKAELAAKRAAKKAGKEAAAGQVDVASLSLGDVSTPGSSAKLTSEQRRVAANRAVTGVLASMPAARDIKFASFSVSVGGRQLVADSNLELTQGCRYGLLGDNGSGKSNVLAAVAQREVPLPEHVSVYHLHEEAPPTELSGVEAVIEHVRAEVERLEAMSEAILEAVGPEDERLEAINDRLSELDPTGSEPRARKILSGLGFADHLVPMDRPTKHMSGGWRMRVALAQALFAAPELLLLDEPTNHLDLEACVWLEEHLASYPKCLLLVSHSQDFLNAVCTHTLWLSGRLLRLYGGNYAKFVQTVEEEERLQLKVYEKQQADIDKLSDFVRVNKANGVASSAKSKKKVLEKLETGAVEKPKLREPSLTFSFPECSRLAPPVLPFDDVSFAYPGSEPLYEALNFGVDCDSRIALVGPNGCGKSTLLKLMSGELSPTAGSVKKHQHCSLGLYHQHSTDVLDLDMAPLPFLRKVFPPSVVKHTEEWWRGYLATFGFSPEQQQSPMGMLSHGQRSRIVFAMLAMKDHTVLLLDEPTNHLDVDAVDGLAAAIKAFGGGVVLVSHDFRLIDQVADEIWLCEDRGVRRLEGSIHEYKKALAKKMSKHKVGLR